MPSRYKYMTRNLMGSTSLLFIFLRYGLRSIDRAFTIKQWHARGTVLRLSTSVSFTDHYQEVTTRVVMPGDR